MNKDNPREIAVKVLSRRTEGRYVEDLLEEALVQSALSGVDRGLCQELVYGVVRWQAALDWLIHRKTDGRTQKPLLRILLQTGLYQLFWLDRIPGHAAVYETVELARRLGCGPQAGFINALLRGYLREEDATRARLADLRAAQPHVGWSHPEWLVNRWEARYGKEAAGRLLQWNNTPPLTYARVNTLKAAPELVLEKWRSERVEFEFISRPWLPENLCFLLRSHPALVSLPSFQEGLFYIQDPSTFLAPLAVGIERGERVLDLCAAPGGKLTFMAQLARNECRIVAHDNSPERMKLLEANCRRLGVTGVSTTTSAAELRGHDLFDKILLDAPCSNTGVMRRRVDLRWRIQPKELDRLRATQAGLLEESIRLLKSGGRLVYSTCSIEPEENGLLIKELLAAHREMDLVSESELLPQRDECDGAYVATMRRR